MIRIPAPPLPTLRLPTPPSITIMISGTVRANVLLKPGLRGLP